MTCRRQFLKQLGALALAGAAAPAVLAKIGTPSAPRPLPYRTGEVMVQDYWGGEWRRGNRLALVTSDSTRCLGRITAVGHGSITVEWDS